MNRHYVTVVSGLPRSGTSLLMQMLAAGGLEPFTDSERPADEDNPRGYYEHAAVKRLANDNEWLSAAVGKAIKIVAPLLRHVPADVPCRVVFVDRDLDEVLSSQATMLARRGQQGSSLPTERLRRVYETQLSAIHAMLAKRSGTDVLRIRYAEVVKDPSAAALRLAEFLGSGLDVNSMAAAVDASLYRNCRKD